MPIVVTDAGMVIDVKPVQALNASLPIDVTVKPANVLGISNGPAYVVGAKPVIVAFTPDVV
jgi:hypothetical protein